MNDHIRDKRPQPSENNDGVEKAVEELARRLAEFVNESDRDAYEAHLASHGREDEGYTAEARRLVAAIQPFLAQPSSVCMSSTEIERWRYWPEGMLKDGGSVSPALRGDWVKYSDHEATLSAVAASTQPENSGDETDCERCGGKGRLRHGRTRGISDEYDCPDCGGTGTTPENSGGVEEGDGDWPVVLVGREDPDGPYLLADDVPRSDGVEPEVRCYVPVSEGDAGKAIKELARLLRREAEEGAEQWATTYVTAVLPRLAGKSAPAQPQLSDEDRERFQRIADRPGAITEDDREALRKLASPPVEGERSSDEEREELTMIALALKNEGIEDCTPEQGVERLITLLASYRSSQQPVLGQGVEGLRERLLSEDVIEAAGAAAMEKNDFRPHDPIIRTILDAAFDALSQQGEEEGGEAKLREALRWAMGWIDHCSEVPVKGDEDDDHRRYRDAKALLDSSRPQQQEVGPGAGTGGDRHGGSAEHNAGDSSSASAPPVSVGSSTPGQQHGEVEEDAR